MRRKISFLNLLIISSLSLFLTNCGTAFLQPVRTHPARVGESSALTSTLRELPAPKEPILVAVYQFRDQTGQYKPQDGGGSFSTAVTQGAANILVKVLQDSKWFEPVERENIGDLLNERKIIRSTRQQFGINEELPALLYAGVLLEGGIVSYDANVVTGGAGLRYFGTGGGSQYRQDRVTVYLRATSVSNGKILKTVYASKMVLSQSVDGGVFKFVKFSRLLEAETGFTFNEPSELAVTEAIEKAVETLIYEGIDGGLWELKDSKKKRETLENWKKSKEIEEKTDVLNQLTDNRRKRNEFSIASSHLLYKGDYARPRLKTGAEIGIGFNPKPHFGWGFKLGVSQLATEKGFSTQVSFMETEFRLRYTPFYRFSPSVRLGAGAIQSEISGKRFAKAHLGSDMEWLLRKNMGFSLGFDYNYTFSDLLDNRENGRYGDAFWRGNVGLHFYFGQKIKNKKPIGSPPAAPSPPAKKPGVLRDY